MKCQQVYNTYYCLEISNVNMVIHNMYSSSSESVGLVRSWICACGVNVCIVCVHLYPFHFEMGGNKEQYAPIG